MSNKVEYIFTIENESLKNLEEFKKILNINEDEIEIDVNFTGSFSFGEKASYTYPGHASFVEDVECKIIEISNEKKIVINVMPFLTYKFIEKVTEKLHDAFIENEADERDYYQTLKDEDRQERARRD